MMTRSFGHAPAKSQRGYALLMVIFLVATLLVVAIGKVRKNLRPILSKKPIR